MIPMNPAELAETQRLNSINAYTGQGVVLAFSNQKGGVGKTTSSVAIATIYAKRGLRVLLVDNDPQANSSKQLGFDPQQVMSLGERTISQVYLEKIGLNEIAQQTAFCDNLFLAPSSLFLAEVESNLPGQTGCDTRLKLAVSEARYNWDVIIIDSPPNLGKCCVNALAACQYIMIPVDAVWSLDAIKALMVVDGKNKRHYGTSSQIGCIFFTLADSTNVTKFVQEEAVEMYSQYICSVSIPRAKEGREAALYNQPVPVYSPKSKLAIAYDKLADEMAEKVHLKMPVIA